MSRLNFTLEQATKLFDMQHTLNSYIHPDWIAQDFDWYEAIIDECGEIKGHLGWKWWRENYQCGVTETNKAQIKLEVIDILHFLISGLTELGVKPEQFAWHTAHTIPPYAYTVEDAVQDLRSGAVNKKYNINSWIWIAELLDMDAQEILEIYIQKYVLNKFRQDHGYKDGSYCKEWEYVVAPFTSETAEDNVVLSQEVNAIQREGQDTTDETILYERLELRYNSRLNK